MTGLVADRLPLFPLRKALLPGGHLRLRVFERRYLDMVRDCAREGRGFGICLMLDGDRPGVASAPAAVGTCAKVVDFHSRDDGLLGIVVEGGRRFKVERSGVRADGLILAEVRWLPDDRTIPVPAEHGLLAGLLRQMLEHFGELPDAGEWLDDTAWVGWRLAERLPLLPEQQQCLLQTETEVERLDWLAHWLSQQRTR